MNNLIETIVSYGTLIATLIGVLAFVTSIITQVTKGWGFLKKIPTEVQVYVTSLVITLLSVIVYLQMNNSAVLWYYIVGAIIFSFFVAFVTTNGWKQFIALWNRFYDKED